MKNKRVLVAMSGGVDSSVAAGVLLDEGYEVHGVTMQIWPEADEEQCSSQGCCSLSAVEDARRVANRLGIPYHVFNFRDVFERSVIAPFIDEYVSGRTPNPCVLCNRVVKFEALLTRALALGFDYIATGHYGIVAQPPGGRYELRRAVTQEKDQTYALYNLTQHQLAHLLLPVGGMTKPQVRDYAKRRGLPVFDKPDSQEICFVPDNDYAGFIERAGHPSVPGNFIDLQGNIIGRHRGIYHYTIGQRKGLGGGFSEPMYVVKIDPARGEITLGRDEDTRSSTLHASDLNWLSLAPQTSPFKCEAKVRYNGGASAAVVTPDEKGAKVDFLSPARAVTPGQSVVFYDGDRVLGGGVID